MICISACSDNYLGDSLASFNGEDDLGCGVKTYGIGIICNRNCRRCLIVCKYDAVLLPNLNLRGELCAVCSVGKGDRNCSLFACSTTCCTTGSATCCATGSATCSATCCTTCCAAGSSTCSAARGSTGCAAGRFIGKNKLD